MIIIFDSVELALDKQEISAIIETEQMFYTVYHQGFRFVKVGGELYAGRN
jgi:hypothetical protein